MSNCKCNHPRPECRDVCVTPICGTPHKLTLMAPVVYDEMGINLCRAIPIPADAQTRFATASKVSVQIVSATLPAPTTVEPQGTTVTRIPERPLCLSVFLTNVALTLSINFYDCCNQFLGNIVTQATYLPSENNADSEYFNEDTNPRNITVEIYAPYGGSFTTSGADLTVNYLGFTPETGALRQGINITGIPKVLDTNIANGFITLGVTFILQSIYYTPYKVPTLGRADVPRAYVDTSDTVCQQFVEGDLLEWKIKPLELGPPKFDEKFKNECPDEPSCSPLE